MHEGGDYSSEFEYDSEVERKRKRRNDLVFEKKSKSSLPSKRKAEDEVDREEAKIRRYHILSMDAYTRHKKMINDYMLYYHGQKSDFQRDTSKDKTDMDVIRENHRFLWEDDEDADTWEKKLAKKYYDKLFKEYCIVDLSRYKLNQIAMRWRTEKELINGRGQFTCGNKSCNEKEDLKSWEVNFGYVEHGAKKNALVKIRLCPDCSYKLNYKNKRKEVIKGRKKKLDFHHSTEEDEKTDEKKCLIPVTSNVGVETSSTSASSIWEGPIKVDVEKSRDEEFEEYLEDLFL